MSGRGLMGKARRRGGVSTVPACLPLPSRRLLAALLGLGLTVLAAPALHAESPTGWRTAEETVVLDDLEGPVDLAIAPDGALWWNEFYSGDVRRYDGDTIETTFHTDPIEDPVERGLVGLALDPEVTDNGVFYVYYTVADPEDPAGGTNHLARVEDGQQTRLLEIPAHQRHNGGRITVDDEGRLFVSTGDNTERHPAQDTGSLLGKILHLDPDGTPANDTIEGPVYSIGHRNVYGLAYDAETDRLFATENNDLERDEVNLIEAGHNYGWPDCQGTKAYDVQRGEPTDEPCEDPDYTDPIGEFYANYTAAPTGATMFDGDLYWAAWNQGEIHRMTRTDSGEWRDRVVHETDDRIHDVEAHGGALYYTNWTQVVRLDLGRVDGEHVPVHDSAKATDPTGSGAVSEIPAASGLVPVLAALAIATRPEARR